MKTFLLLRPSIVVLLFVLYGASALQAGTVTPSAPGVLWTKQIGPDSYGAGLEVDPSGNVYVAGNFSGAQVSVGGIVLTGQGSQNGFVAKYDRPGNLLWVRQVSGGAYGNGIVSLGLDA